MFHNVGRFTVPRTDDSCQSELFDHFIAQTAVTVSGEVQSMTITIEELQFQGRVESYIVWAVPALVKLRWYYVEYTYEGKQ